MIGKYERGEAQQVFFLLPPQELFNIEAAAVGCFRSQQHLEVSFPLLQFHRAFAVMIDHPVFALGVAHRDQLGDQGRDYLDRMRASAGRMGRLIEDLLGFSRVTTDAERKRRTVFNGFVSRCC